MEIRESLKIAKLYEKIRDAYFVNIKFTEGREKFNKVATADDNHTKRIRND